MILINYFVLLIATTLCVKSFSKIPDNGDYPYFHKFVEINSNSPANKVQLLNNGVAALQKRLLIIGQANHSISLESFEFDPGDISIRLILQALLEKAKKGVQVRILVDAGVGSWKLRTKHIDILNALCVKEAKNSCKPIELKLYNDTLFIMVSSEQYRNHRKMLLVDDTWGITGGRNLADEYFGIDDSYSVIDRDLFIKGPLVLTMRKAFDKFWDCKLSSPMETDRLSEIFYAKENEFDSGDYGEGPSFEDIKRLKKTALKKYNKQIQFIINNDAITNSKTLKQNDKDKEFLQKINTLGNKLLKSEPTGGCEEITFVSDKAGWKRLGSANYYSDDKEDARIIGDALRAFTLENTQHEILMSTPYIVNTDASKKMMQTMLNKNINITIMTNSLFSTDTITTTSMLYQEYASWLDKGVSMFLHSGYALDDMNPIDENIKKSRWGMHTKTYLYDDNAFYIGSYNMDNRSDFYNTEAGIFCKGGNLPRELKKDMEFRRSHYIQLIGKDRAIDRYGNPTSIYSDATMKMRIKRALKTPIAKMIHYLL